LNCSPRSNSLAKSSKLLAPGEKSTTGETKSPALRLAR
jgi:hypothetical protein